MIEPTEYQELYCKLEQIERQLRRRDAVEVALRQSCLALAIGTLLTLLGKVLGFGSPVLLLFICAALVLALAGGATIQVLSQRRTLSHVARVCDRQLGLRERLATALEVIGTSAQGPLAQAQVLDARRVLDAIDLEHAFRVRWPTSSSALALVLMSVLIATSQLPVPLTRLVSSTATLPLVEVSGADARGSASAEAGALQIDLERQKDLERRTQQLADDITSGQANSAEIVGRLNRAEIDLRPLLTRPDPTVRDPAMRLSERLHWLRQSADLSDSINQRDYASVASLLQTVTRRMPTLSNDERLVITFILARGGRQDADAFPNIAQFLQLSSAAVALGDQDQLAAAIHGLSFALAVPVDDQLALPVPSLASADESAPPQ